MKKYPFIKQTEQKDCAPTCMSMILKYYGAYVSMEELRDITNTDKYGVNVYDLVEAFKKYGFESEALEGNIEELKKEKLIFPFIAHLTINNGHYVVVYEINFKKNKIVIGDPGSKLKAITINEFLKVWDNIIVTMYPVRKLPYKPEKINIYTFIMQFIKYQKINLWQVLIFSFMVTILTICSSYYFQFIIDALDNNQKLFAIFLSFIFLGITKEITNYMKNKVFNYVKYKMDIDINYDVYKQMIYLPFKYYADRSVGDIISRINNLNNVKEYMCDIILNFITGIFISIISMILLFTINEKLLFLAIINIAIYTVISLLFNKYFKTKINDIQENKGAEISYLTETINSYNTIKGINLYKYVLNKYKNKIRLFSYEYLKTKNTSEIMNLLENVISLIFSCFIIYEGALMINKGEISIGKLITFNYLFGYFFEPVKTILDSLLNLNEIKSSIKRIIDLYYYEKNESKEQIAQGNIKIKNLSFAYNYNNILKNINLSIQKNEKIMVIGESGSGKSSLFKLLMKYYKPNKGSIKIDDIDINNINIGNDICYISQNEMLFTASLYDNLVLDSKVKQKEVEEISNKVYVNKKNYKMLIEDNGFNLSGGEKMRIVLARTLLRNPKILIIDEGLNMVDVNLERKILKNILNMDMTIIFVSHRLDNIDLFKRVVELKEGKIIKDVSVCNSN